MLAPTKSQASIEMADDTLKQQLAELVADLKDLAGSLATAAPVRCRQLLALTNSVERHFEHLVRCDSISARDLSLRDGRDEREVALQEEVVRRMPQATQQANNTEWPSSMRMKGQRSG
jgi:hypothetical protein